MSARPRAAVVVTSTWEANKMATVGLVLVSWMLHKDVLWWQFVLVVIFDLILARQMRK